MTKRVAVGIALVLGVEAIAMAILDRRLVLIVSGVAVAMILLAVRLDLGAPRRLPEGPIRDDAGESLEVWKSQTESLIWWADSTRADWDRHLRPRLAREFLTATREKDPVAVEATGRMVFGDEWWQWVDPNNVSQTSAPQPGPGRAGLSEILRRMEQI